MQVSEKVQKCIEENGIIILENGDFENLDSINFISTIVDIESEFDIEFPEEYLLMDTFYNFENIVFIVKKLIENKDEEA